MRNWITNKRNAEVKAIVEMNPAEKRLQMLVAEKVASQEKELGFKFDDADVAETEKILRNKYCGKAGLFSSMEGGTCREDVIQAAFCTNDARISSMSGCDAELGIKREPGLGNLFKP